MRDGNGNLIVNFGLEVEGLGGEDTLLAELGAELQLERVGEPFHLHYVIECDCQFVLFDRNLLEDFKRLLFLVQPHEGGLVDLFEGDGASESINTAEFELLLRSIEHERSLAFSNQECLVAQRLEAPERVKEVVDASELAADSSAEEVVAEVAQINRFEFGIGQVESLPALQDNVGEVEVGLRQVEVLSAIRVFGRDKENLVFRKFVASLGTRLFNKRGNRSLDLFLQLLVSFFALGHARHHLNQLEGLHRDSLVAQEEEGLRVKPISPHLGNLL